MSTRTHEAIAAFSDPGMATSAMLLRSRQTRRVNDSNLPFRFAGDRVLALGPFGRGLVALVICILVNVPGVFSSAAAQASPRNRDLVPPNILYSAGGHLWVRPVDGGVPRLIRTPWPMASHPRVYAQWSPDGRRIALDDGRSRLAVISLASGHVTILPRGYAVHSLPPAYSWSPNGRYLAFLALTGEGDRFSFFASFRFTLMVWDSSRGTRRTLLGGVCGTEKVDWSRDGTQLLVNTGRCNVRRNRNTFPSVTVVDLNGHEYTLGTGMCCYGAEGSAYWSPDDRLIASLRYHNWCLATACVNDELVRRSSGGPAIVLARNIDSNFEDVEWAPQANGYAFDRWLLNASGHITRRLAGPHERVDAWEPDGSHLAVQTFRPYERTPDALYISTLQGKRVHLYTDGPNTGCGACSKDVYGITWSHGGRLLAFTTPEYPAPKGGTPFGVTVYPMIFLGGIHGGPLTRVPVPGNIYPVDVVAFVNNDQEMVVDSGRKIYRYVIATHRLTPIATGVITDFGIPAMDPSIVR